MIAWFDFDAPLETPDEVHEWPPVIPSARLELAQFEACYPGIAPIDHTEFMTSPLLQLTFLTPACDTAHIFWQAHLRTQLKAPHVVETWRALAQEGVWLDAQFQASIDECDLAELSVAFSSGNHSHYRFPNTFPPMFKLAHDALHLVDAKGEGVAMVLLRRVAFSKRDKQHGLLSLVFFPADSVHTDTALNARDLWEHVTGNEL